MKILQFTSTAAAAVLALAMHSPATAQEINDNADKVLHQMADYYQGLDGLRVSLMAKSIRSRGDESQEASMTSSLSVKKPNMLHSRLDADGDTMSVISNDSALAIDLGPMKAYIQKEAVDNFDGLLADREAAALTGLIFYQKLIVADPYAAMTEGLESATMGDTTDASGGSLQELKLVYENSTINLWLQNDDTPVLVKLQAGERATGSRGNGIDMSTEVVYTAFEENPAFSAREFDHDMPEGYTRYDSLEEAVRASMPTGGPKIGEKAPGIALKLADGSPLTHATNSGNNVVVLDFWATWCPPCREGLPLVDKVAAAYEGKGVKVYAVNLREPQEKAVEYLEKANLDNVILALDKTGGTATTWGVQSIPTTVVIDKDGNLVSLHTGYSPDLAEKLSKEIDKALEGSQ